MKKTLVLIALLFVASSVHAATCTQPVQPTCDEGRLCDQSSYATEVAQYNSCITQNAPTSTPTLECALGYYPAVSGTCVRHATSSAIVAQAQPQSVLQQEIVLLKELIALLTQELKGS